MSDAFTQIISVAIAIVGLAIVAVILSKQANTANVITASGKALGGAIGAAVSPITGGGGFSSGAYGDNLMQWG